jgi:hypothetical protein
MYIDNIEATYLIGRVQDSRDRAIAAQGPCARHAHEELAERYAMRLASMLRTSAVALPTMVTFDFQPEMTLY